MHTNWLVWIVFAFLAGVVFLFMLCETLMRLERRKAFNKSIRYKPSERYQEGGFNARKASAPPGGAVAAAGYMLLPVHKTHPDEIVIQGGNPDDVHKVPDDPRSGEAWQRQDSAGSYGGDRKEDPWISKNGTAILATPTNKPIVEEPSPDKGGNTGIADVAAIAVTAAVVAESAQSTVATSASVEQPPPFSTAGFWEAREAAKDSGSTNNYYGVGGGSDFGGGSGGGYGSGAVETSTNGWGGGDYSNTANEKESWNDSSDL